MSTVGLDGALAGHHAPPAVQEVDRVLGEQNPWHQQGEVPGVLAPPVERALARQLWSHVLSEDPRRFHLVLGPRRVGKTTAMDQTAAHLMAAGTSPERLWWLRMDHPVLLRESLGDLVRHVVEPVTARLERLDGRGVKEAALVTELDAVTHMQDLAVVKMDVSE